MNPTTHQERNTIRAMTGLDRPSVEQACQELLEVLSRREILPPMAADILDEFRKGLYRRVLNG